MKRQAITIGKANTGKDTPKDKISKETVETSLKDLIIARFGEEVFKKWKQEFKRELNIIKVEDKLAVLRPIGAKEIALFSGMVAGDEGLDKASEYLLNELWLDGDEELFNDEEYFISAMLQLQRTLQVKKSSFYKL